MDIPHRTFIRFFATDENKAIGNILLIGREVFATVDAVGRVAIGTILRYLVAEV
ncbi:hypothetical protein [Buttiauxella sp. B2]|uniref:hypothetical protein n=1 Tax=Buttiauxella sp. B2 TaxID=2587812 RepID=UPI0016721751|nr:hypothetical protein [Buttiauxella sp. B2]